MAKLLFFICATYICLREGAAYSSEKKLNPLDTAVIPPFMQYLNMIHLDWFIRNVSILDDTQCNKDLYSILEALNNNELWPKLMLDASAGIEPGIFHQNSLYIGAFDECLWTRPKNVNFTTQYCLISSSSEFDYKQFGLPYIKSPMVQIGKCLPSSCSREYLNKVIAEFKIPNTDHLLSEIATMDIKQGDCQKENGIIPLSTLNYITIAILLSMLCLVMISTIYDLWQKSKNKTERLHVFFSSFSLIENINQTLMLSEKATKPNVLTCIKGITALFIVYYHSFYIPLVYNSDLQNAWDLINYNNNYAWSYFFGNYSSFVDIFLFLSGFIMVIAFFASLKNKGRYSPVASILKRYILIMSPLLLIILIRMGISEHLGDGPVYNSINNNLLKKLCEGNVWPTIFVYHNYKYSAQKMCFQHSWYLPVDVHLYTIGHLILFVAHWNKKIGCSFAAAMSLLGATTEFIIAYIYDLAPAAAIDPVSSDYDYALTHTRSAPWFAGMVFGFITLHIKKKKIRLATGKQVIWWFICVTCFLATTVPMTYFDYKNIPQPHSAIYLSVRRLTWSVFLGWMILASTDGYSGFLAKISSFKFIIFLGNISFELYVVHVMVIEYFVATARSTYYFSPNRVIYHAFAFIWFSIIFAIILAVTFTTPLRKLLNYYLRDIKIFTIYKKELQEKNIEQLK